MSLAKTICWNTFLIFLGLSFGSYTGDGCYYDGDDICLYWYIVTINTFLSKWFTNYAGAIAIVLLALTSETTQMVLATDFMQFFGRISYSLYLVHELFIFWPENDLVRELSEGQGLNYKLSVFIAWLIFTPVLVLFSWLLTILVDEPFKDFAYEIDIVWRKKKPPVKTPAARSAIAGV